MDDSPMQFKFFKCFGGHLAGYSKMLKNNKQFFLEGSQGSKLRIFAYWSSQEILTCPAKNFIYHLFMFS